MSRNKETLLSPFDMYMYVASILKYDCEVLGSHNASDAEKMQLEFKSF